LIQVSEKFCPLIVDVALTSDLENKLESVMQDKIKHTEVIEYAKTNIEKIFQQISPNIQDIGKELISTLK
jgi:DNA topoisomerase IA